MAQGYSNLVQSDSGMKILLRVVLNTLGDADATAFTKDNKTGTQALANSTVTASTPKGVLGGMVVAATGAGLVGAATTDSGVLGLAENNAVGNAYESMSGIASGKIPYLCGAGSVAIVDKYETCGTAGAGAPLTYAAGDKLYASANGLLCNAAGTTVTNGVTPVVAICLVPPTTTNAQMTVQLRI